jgi:hypothetical protein
MENLGERLRSLSDYYKLSIRALEHKVGVSEGTFSKIINYNKDTGSENIRKICLTFPEVNPAWILMGELPMFRTNAGSEELDRQKEEIRRLERTLLTMNEQLTHYLKRELGTDEKRDVGT